MCSSRNKDNGQLVSFSPDVLQRPHSPLLVYQNHNQHRSNLQHFFAEAISSTNPSLRHLASHSSFGSATSEDSYVTAASHFQPYSRGGKFKSGLGTKFENQRYAGHGRPLITKNTKEFDPFQEKKLDQGENTTGFVGKDLKRFSSLPHVDGAQTALSHSGSSMVDCQEKYMVPKQDLQIGLGAGRAHYSSGLSEVLSYDSLSNEPPVQKSCALDEDSEDLVYPKPLGLFILITGIALSVFLISLDRTIITTAIPYITSEFQSYDDLGWYGSAYLLTASAFQPLYGRIFMLFDMKWSYLVALGFFELGSLICGITRSSMTLIIGRAIAGVGSAGILTGSFIIVSHAVPLNRRPVLTAVVGLMFGVGATAGPLLGGVFTDLVTWRWCFYFNIPVGSATLVSMIFFFHPPKSHMLMGKSFSYRIMELDIVGNVILLGASVMLFLALQLTERRVSWGSAEVVGLLAGAGVTFFLFCVWMWWKQDGALMPPRILQQRTVAAACAAGFFIYSAILIQTYYLPIYFQAIRSRSAIGSGVDMIPYVLANAFFSLLAGIFVSKNGYFTAPAIIGMCIATIGCGLISRLQMDTSTAKWVGYEILASAGFGMAIQQGFTAVQIVLPLDEVAIGTAAVVAFQSLGGAVFVSVGNTILQNTLYAAHIPGINIQTVVDDGAASFRDHLTPEQVSRLIVVYQVALQKVFIAAIPMAGLAVFSCACMEWRNVKDQDRADEEKMWKVRKRREDMERGLVDSAARGKRGSRKSSRRLTVGSC